MLERDQVFCCNWINALVFGLHNLARASEMLKAYSDAVIRFYDVQAFIVPPLSIACCAILVLVVFRHTPRQMGALKW